MRLLQVGQRDIILSPKPSGYVHQKPAPLRCPCEIDVAMIMDTLRIIARRENKVSEKDIKLFTTPSLILLKEHGRLFEMGTLLSYNLKSGHFFADADLGPKVLEKGKFISSRRR